MSAAAIKAQPWRDALLLLAVQLVIFAPVLCTRGVLLPVADSAAPPWSAQPATSDGQDYAGTDRAVFCWPNWVRIQRALHGEGPSLHWNPDNLCGTPFLGTLDTAVFGMTTLLLVVADVPLAALLAAILLGWVAALCARMALRRWIHDDRAALLGAALFSASPWFLGHQDVFPFVESAAWTPLLFYGADVCVRERRGAGVVALAAGFALSFFGGLPQLTLVACTAAGCVALGTAVHLAAQRSGRAALGGAGLALLGIFCGLLLTLPALLPGLETSRSSARADLAVADLRANAMQPMELSGLLLPDLLGAPARLHAAARAGTLPPDVTEENFPLARLAQLPTHGASHLERLCAIGALGALAVLVALTQLRERRVRWAVALLCAGLLLAMATPLLDLLLLVPGFNFGSSRRWIFWTVLAMVFLASVGLEQILKRPRQRSMVVCSTLLLLFSGGVLLCCGFLPERIAGFFAGPAATQMPAWIISVTWPLTAALGAALLLWRLLGGTALCLGLLLLVAAEGALVQWQLNPAQHSAHPFPTTETTRFLQEAVRSSEQGPPWRIARFRSAATDIPEAQALPAPLPPNLNTLYDLPDIHGYEGMLQVRYEQLLQLVEPDIAVAHHLIREFHAPAALAHPILDLLGAKIILSPGRLELPLLAAFVPERCALYRNEGAQPLAQLPMRWVACPDDPAVLAALDAPDYRPEALAFLRQDDADRLGWTNGFSAATAALPHLRVDRRADEILVHFADNAEPRPLLLAAVHHKEWRAYAADGSDLPLVRADHALMATRLPAGTGTIRIVYCPQDFQRGCLGAVVGFVLLGITAALLRRRKESAC